VKNNIFFKFILFLCFIVLISNIYSQENDSLINIITINSDPSGAEVFLNSSLIGKTPFTLKNQSPGKLAFLIKLDDKNSFSETVHYNGGELVIYPLFNADHSILEIITKPDNAFVYFNDSLVGTTPIYDLIIPLGLHEIKIEKDDYIKYERKFNFQRKKTKWNYNLTYKYGFVNSNVNGLDINLKVNGIEVLNDDKQFVKTEIGNSTFEASWKNEKSISRYFKIEPEKYYSVVYKTDYFTPVYMLESMIIPGSGQFTDDAQIKGVLYFLTNVAFGYLFLNENSNYKEKYDSYNSAKVNYMDAKNENDAIQLRTVMEQALNDVNSSADKKNIYLGCFIGAYLLNVLDAFVFHTEGFDMELIEVNNHNLGINTPQLEIKYPLK